MTEPDFGKLLSSQKVVDSDFLNYARLTFHLTSAVTPALKEDITKALQPHYLGGEIKMTDTPFLALPVHFDCSPEEFRRLSVPVRLNEIFDGIDGSGSRHSSSDIHKAGDLFLRIGTENQDENFYYFSLLFYIHTDNPNASLINAGNQLLEETILTKNNHYRQRSYHNGRNIISHKGADVLSSHHVKEKGPLPSWYYRIGRKERRELQETYFEQAEIWPNAAGPMINAFAYAGAYDRLKDAAVRLVQEAELSHCAVMALKLVKQPNSEAGIEKTAASGSEGGK